MDIGRQFERLGIKTQGLAEYRNMADYKVEINNPNTRDPDTFDRRRYIHESDAARYGGSGKEASWTDTSGFRQPHAADWMQWHVQQGYEMNPKSSRN